MADNNTNNMAGNNTPAVLSDEDQEKQREDWREELEMTEKEILTLMQVIGAKEEQARHLKRRLGVTAWAELSEELVVGVKTLQESSLQIAQSMESAGSRTARAVSGYLQVWSSMVGETYRGSQFQFNKQGGHTDNQGGGTVN